MKRAIAVLAVGVAVLLTYSVALADAIPPDAKAKVDGASAKVDGAPAKVDGAPVKTDTGAVTKPPEEKDSGCSVGGRAARMVGPWLLCGSFCAFLLLLGRRRSR